MDEKTVGIGKMESILMTSKHLKIRIYAACLLLIPIGVFAHDTTHIHPLITDKIRQLIQDKDNTEKSYLDIYKLTQDPVDNVDPKIQFLYWGTDFDARELSKPGINEQEHLLGEQQQFYNSYITVIDGVVQEDVPGGKVTEHFYHAESGKGLNGPLINENGPSSKKAMSYFNESIARMGGYTEEAKHTAFFEFGHALHHVEDMLAPAHIHNDAENALFDPIRRYGQLKNTHVVNSTLRFLNCPCLVLKQTASFSGVDV